MMRWPGDTHIEPEHEPSLVSQASVFNHYKVQVRGDIVALRRGGLGVYR